MKELLLASQLRLNDQFEIGGFLHKVTEIVIDDKQIVLTVASFQDGLEYTLRVEKDKPFIVLERT